MTLAVQHGALSDIGLHRKTNEDSYVVEPPLFAVCDGMGGAQAGEVASSMAATTLATAVADGRPLAEAAAAANTAVYEHAAGSDERAGMGTTLTAFVLEADRARFAHIGDSRAYLLRGGELRQLSDDHSLVAEMVRDGRLTAEEAAVHPHRSILSRALGTEPRASIDAFVVDLLPDDVVLLCSDGLSGVVPEDGIRKMLGRPDPRDAAQRLIREARKQGGPDNITAVVVRFSAAAAEPPRDEPETTSVAPGADEVTAELPPVVDGTDATAGLADRSETAESRTSSAPSAAGVATLARDHRRGLVALVVVLVVLVAVAAAGAVVLSTVFFIGVDDGRLAVFSGLPVELGPIKLHAVYRRSSRAYASLSVTERTTVDARGLRGKAEVMSLSDSLGMWP